ncbi:TraB/GumN family protein [Erysipelothrix urinaevulpis]|uniref:TraB/GumN family protein n=1 Tax=Erysipelothrix urinaevulpis TaxID=2683717 RepID=UPI00135B085E|nr:TraB/GumN family protein [Erysipelothrix urinaevulpis]
MKTIHYENKTIHFVPTAHVSKQSVEDVRHAIETTQPDAVLIELDAGRAHGLMNESERQSDIDVIEIIKNKEFANFSAKLLMGSFQKKIAEDLETEVGAEMKEAIILANDLGITKYYIDRDINTTMQRLWGDLGFFKKTSFIVSLVLSSFDSKEEIDIEELKQEDMLFKAMSEMDTKLPQLSNVILHERNEYMAKKIMDNPYDNLVVVIGAAHLDGIIENLGKDISLYQLDQIPLKKKTNPLQWILPIIFVLLFTVLFFKNPTSGKDELIRWILLSSGLSTLGALLVGAHPKTLVATIIGAPLGILSPVLAVGFFSGIAEAYARPPKVSDFENLSDDASSVKMWFKNRFLRIILIMFVTSLLSSIGTFIVTGKIISKLL